LINTRITDGDNEIIICTHQGQACRFSEVNVRPMGRTATGVRGISLQKDDYVVSMIAVKSLEEQVIVVSEKGFGKRTKVDDFRKTSRGAKGVIAMKTTSRTGKLVALLTVKEDDEIIVMTTHGIIIRQAVKSIRVIGRNTQGVKLIKLDEGDSIADITIIPKEDEDGENLEQQFPGNLYN